jgi:stage II sporulation protein D
MMFRGNVSIVGGLLVCLFFSLKASNPLSSSCHVRVLLDQKEPSESYWEIMAEQGLLAVDVDNDDNRTVSKGVRIKVSCQGLRIIDTKRKMLAPAQCIKIIAHTNDYLVVDEVPYQGFLLLICEKNQALLINSVDLDDYIFSVLNTESYPGWPLEMNKVLAVAVRTYVIAKVCEAQQQGKYYHIKNTNAHQTYRGYHEKIALRQAVSQTQGLFLSYENEPILAMYDICCGGIIPAQKKGVDFARAPYLARTYPCNFCKKTKTYRWSLQYTMQELERLLKKEVRGLGELKEIKIAEKDDAGIVHSLLIKGSQSSHTISHKKFTTLFKNIKSFCFSLIHKVQHVIVRGRGFGHHMGLCQWGARQLVREGWDYKRILQFYYPGTKIMRLQIA